MLISATLLQLDQLLHDCKLSEAEQFLNDAIATAKADGDIDAEKTLRNEQIGFYRDCGRFPEALETASAVRALFESAGETETVSYATTLLNCANAYRAAGKYPEAYTAYATVKQRYEALLPQTDDRMASLWNNLALLEQETKHWEKACDCLSTALALVRKSGSDTRVAISCTNLAVSLLRLHKTAEARPLLQEADQILKGRTPSDFHYSATLAGFGDMAYQMGDYTEAVAYYETALSEIELHMGQNNFYTIVSENLAQAYEKLGISRPQLSGMALSLDYYNAFGKPMLERQFSDLLPKLAIGLVGEGSECLGYDDALSHDHDFGAGFCIWTPDDLPEADFTRLKTAYASLPPSYRGIRRIVTPEAGGRVGVCRTGDFFRRLLGMPHLPQTEAQWLTADEAMLAILTSGTVFRDESGSFTKMRRKLSLGYPKAVKLRRLAQQLARMAQCGQYNYLRMRKRGDIATAQLYLASFCKSAMQAAHLCRNTYAPYEKWLLRSTTELDGFSDFAETIRSLLLLPPQTTTEIHPETDTAVLYIQQICQRIQQEVAMEHQLEQNPNAYLADTANQLATQAEAHEAHETAVERIVQLEWKTFDQVQNIGGRANCQDDWETFSIMRRSQYRPWETALLQQWIAIFEQANTVGRNLITEKYAYMMESTDPTAFAKLKDKLPAVSQDVVNLREAIIAIQVPWMETFSAQYPNLASRARTIHTADDTQWDTSYETYLRGELTVYPFELLYGYGRWIAGLSQQEKNLAQMILEETVHQYGYATLAEAEQNGCRP